MIPWVERVMDYDVRAKPNMITSTSGSRDLQMVRPPLGIRCVRCVRSPAPSLRRGHPVTMSLLTWVGLATEAQGGWLW